MKNLVVSSILTSLVGTTVVVVVARVTVAVCTLVEVVVVVLVLFLIVGLAVSPLLSSSVLGSFPVLVSLSDLVLGVILLIV